MAALDFPSSPTNGQLHPNPAVSGQPQYTYDGEKWTSGTSQGAIYISDSPPAAPVGALWYESDTGMLYVRYNDGSSIQWVSIPGGASDAVRYGVQTLTTSEATQARKNIYAAPLDALAYSGMQINGSMGVSQEKGVAGAASTAGYMCDGWTQYNQGAQVVGGRTMPLGNDTGFSTYLECITNTALASLTASALSLVYHPIEGYRAARLSFGFATAQPITIGFWTAHFRAGLYALRVGNAAGNRNYVTTYTQNVSNVWEYKTVTIPGDTTGTWPIDNTVGLGLEFIRAAGTDWHTATPNTWVGGNAKSVAGAVNGVGATSDFFRLTGVVVLPGIEAPSAARSPLIMRPYDQELLTCRRYWEPLPVLATCGPTAVTSTAYHLLSRTPLTVERCDTPTITLRSRQDMPTLTARRR